MTKHTLNRILTWAQASHVRRAYARKTRGFQRKNPTLNTTLSQTDSEAARRFWSRFGFTIDTAWHGIYAAASGQADVRYVPEDVYYALLEPALNVLEQAPAYSDKNAYERLFPDVRLPPTVLRRINAQHYTGSGTWVSEDDAVSLLVAAAPDDFIVKPSTHSGGGREIALYSRASGPNEAVHDAARRVLVETPGDLIVQARVQQHDALAALHPESLNTLKVLSIRRDGEAAQSSCLLRVGSNGGFTDNGAQAGLCCAVESGGRVRGPWLDSYLRTFDTHPSTGVACDFRVPGVEAARDLVRHMHQRLPYFGIATFDIAIGLDAEPVFIELNLEGQDIQWHQWHNGPLFGELTEWALTRAAERRSQASSKAARFIFRLSH